MGLENISAYERAVGRTKRKGQTARKVVVKAKPVDPDEVVLAPKMLDEAFWDQLTSPLLALFRDGPMQWSDIDAAIGLLEINPRFEHHAVAYLEQKGRIHHVGMTGVTWYYGPPPEEERP